MLTGQGGHQTNHELSAGRVRRTRHMTAAHRARANRGGRRCRATWAEERALRAYAGGAAACVCWRDHIRWPCPSSRSSSRERGSENARACSGLVRGSLVVALLGGGAAASQGGELCGISRARHYCIFLLPRHRSIALVSRPVCAEGGDRQGWRSAPRRGAQRDKGSVRISSPPSTWKHCSFHGPYRLSLLFFSEEAKNNKKKTCVLKAYKFVQKKGKKPCSFLPSRHGTFLRFWMNWSRYSCEASFYKLVLIFS